MKQTIIITESLEQQGWQKNKELCMDVDTYLRSDRRMKAGKSYQGVLRRDVVADEYRYNERGALRNLRGQRTAMGIGGPYRVK